MVKYIEVRERNNFDNIFGDEDAVHYIPIGPNDDTIIPMLYH